MADIIGTYGDDYLSGTPDDDRIEGQGGNDSLYGSFGSDLLIGGLGSDQLDGALGNDTYEFSSGENGYDFIWEGLFGGEAGGFDTIRLNDAYDPAGMQLWRMGPDLSISFSHATGSDQILVVDHFAAGGNNAIEQIEFSDGTVWSATAIANRVMREGMPMNAATEIGDTIGGSSVTDYLYGLGGDDTMSGGLGDDSLYGNDGSDTLFGNDGGDALFGDSGHDALYGNVGFDFLSGGDGNDLLTGGAGNDWMEGGLGDDTFQIGVDAYTQDHIQLGLLEGGSDTLRLGPGLDPSITFLYQQGPDLLVRFSTTNQEVVVRDYFVSPNTPIERIVFADGTTWEKQSIANRITTLNSNQVTEGADTLVGGEWSDHLAGMGGADVISGGAGEDQLSGDTGGDTLFGNGGADYLFGGDGSDSLSGNAGDDVLDGGNGDDRYYFGRGDGNDRINEYITPGNNNRVIFGNGIEYGDLLVSTIGDGIRIQISGTTDELNISDPTNPLGPHTVGVFEFADGTEATFGQLFGYGMYVKGTDADETLSGTFDSDSLHGAGGADTIYGQDGNDTLSGGQGNDWLHGGSGNDRYLFNLGDGLDFIDDMGTPFEDNRVIFGAGITPDDLRIYNVGWPTFHIEVGENRDALNFSMTNPGDPASPGSISTYEFADGTTLTHAQLIARGYHVGGTEYADYLTGSSANDRMYGYGGDDTLRGMGGDDLLVGGAGYDFLDGGAGNDTYTFAPGDGSDTIWEGSWLQDADAGGFDTISLSYDPAALWLDQWGVNLNISSQYGAILVSEQFGNSDRAIERIEFVDGTFWNQAAINSRIAANNANTLTEGADTIVGGDWGEMWSGQGGDDVISGGRGDDMLYGDFGNDTLFGNADSDWLFGGDGDDALHGGRGNDMLSGGFGRDTYYFGVGDGDDRIDMPYLSEDDRLIFGKGIFYRDLAITYSHTSGPAELWLDLAGGEDRVRIVDPFGAAWSMSVQFADGTAARVAQLLGFGSYQLGSTLPDYLYGTYDADNIYANGGSDSIYAYEGDDAVDAGAGDDTVDAGFGNDTVWAQDGNDSVITGDGNDVVYGGAGADTLVGDFGDDYLDAGADIDSVQGGDGNDTLLGGDGNDFINAGAGNDIIEGGRGDDYVVSGTGDDVYRFGLGDGSDWIADLAVPGENNSVEFAAGIQLSDVQLGFDGYGVLSVEVGSAGDRLNLYDFNRDDPYRKLAVDTFALADGTVLSLAQLVDRGFDYYGNDGYNYFQGTSAVDRMYGGSGDDGLYGYLGDDILFGEAGNDSLSGEAGNDVLTGGAGDDILYGWVGSDTYIYNVGDGNDWIIETDPEAGDTDRVVFGEGISASGITAARTGYNQHDLRVSFDESPGGLTFANWFIPDFVPKIEAFHFVDGSVLSAAQIEALANQAPVVGVPLADRSVPEGQFLEIVIPANAFVDADGDPLTLSATLGDGSPLPGWLHFDAASRTLSGVPNDPEIGTHDIRIVAFDSGGLGVYDTFTLNVLNSNDAPVAGDFPVDNFALEDSPFTLTIPAGTFTDVDAGDVLTLSAGTDLLPLPAWLNFDPVSGTLFGTPTNDDTGTQWVRVTATDLAGATASVLFNINVLETNDAPVVITPVVDHTILEDAPYALFFRGAFTDPDGDPNLGIVRYQATLADGSPLPVWLTLDERNGVLRGAPSNADVGALDIALTAIDEFGLAASDTFRLTIENTNDAPTVVGAIVDQSANTNASYTFVVPTTVFTDDDAGDSMVYSATLANGEPLPTWLTFNSSTRTFSGIPSSADVGVLDVRVVATDAAGASAWDDFAITITTLPRVVGTANGEYLQGSNNAEQMEGLAGNDRLDAYAGNDVLIGGAGNDRLNGGTGADTMHGGAGNDIYNVDSSLDVVVELAGEGDDDVNTSISYTLPDHVERLTLSGTQAINATGNSLGNFLWGNAGANVMQGLAGNDRLDGYAGDDTLSGGEGADNLNGGAGNDTYIFNRGWGSDRINDNDATAGNQDRVLFDANPLDIVFARSGSDLQMRLHGSDDVLTVNAWYLGGERHTEIMQTADGRQLLDTQVANLIQAMATFSANNGGITWDQAIDTRPQDVQAVISAYWQPSA